MIHPATTSSGVCAPNVVIFGAPISAAQPPMASSQNAAGRFSTQTSKNC